MAGIAHWINSYFQSEGIDKKFDKRDPVVAKIKEFIDAEYERGRTTTMSDEEMLSFLHRATGNDVWENCRG